MPHGAVGHDTDHLTPLFVESLLTLAVKFAVAPACTVLEVWESDTLMGPVDSNVELSRSPGGREETTRSACVDASAFSDRLTIGTVETICTDPLKF